MLDDVTATMVRAAVAGSGDERTLPLDLQAMDFVRERLSLNDFGRFSVQIARAAAAKRPSELQRLILALVMHRDGGGA